MKAERIGKVLNIMGDETLFVQVSREMAEFLIHYIANAGVDMKRFIHSVEHIADPGLRATAMTIAQQLEQKGRQEGRVDTLHEAILDLLDIRFGEVPGGLKDAVQDIHDESILRNLHRAAARAASLEEFARAL